MKLPRKIPDLSTRSLVNLSISSAFSAVLDATALVTLVPLATTIASGKDSYHGDVMGRSLSLSVAVLVVITLGLIVCRGLTQLVTGHQIARIGSEYEAKRQGMSRRLSIPTGIYSPRS